MATGVFVSGDYAYIANWDSLLVVDVSDPANPNPIGSYSTSKDARDVFVSGDYA